MPFRDHRDARIAQLESENKKLSERLSELLKEEAEKKIRQAEELESRAKARAEHRPYRIFYSGPIETTGGSFLDFFRNPFGIFRKK